MIYIAICDDNNAICAQIENILLGYSRKKGIKVSLDVFYSGESLMNFISIGNNFDLIYLDIELENMNGIEVGRQIRKLHKDYSTEIVYISGNEGYDRQLFDVQPLHFIPKPINPFIIIEDFELALERTHKIGGFYRYQKGYDIYKVPINDIIYFESQNREIRIVTVDREDFFYGKMEDISLSVSEYQFFQIHRSYLINYIHAFILRYSNVVMSNGSILPISRARRQDFRNLQMNEK